MNEARYIPREADVETAAFLEALEKRAQSLSDVLIERLPGPPAVKSVGLTAARLAGIMLGLEKVPKMGPKAWSQYYALAPRGFHRG